MIDRFHEPNPCVTVNNEVGGFPVFSVLYPPHWSCFKSLGGRSVLVFAKTIICSNSGSLGIHERENLHQIKKLIDSLGASLLYGGDYDYPIAKC